MGSKRTPNTRHAGISELAWCFIHSEPLPEPHDPWELFVLQFDYFDPETRYRASDLRELYSKGEF